MSSKAFFTINSSSDNSLVSFQSPVQVSYLVEAEHVMDLDNNVLYPNAAVYQSGLLNNLSKIKDLINRSYFEIDSYKKWNREKWYPVNSLVYHYDEYFNRYRFYKSKGMTIPYIDPINDTVYWNKYDSQKWYDTSELEYNYEYTQGTIVHIFKNGNHSFYESLQDVNDNQSLDNTEYWKPLDIRVWESNRKYNVGTKVYLDKTVYVVIQTVLPYSQLNNKTYWVEYFSNYGVNFVAEKVLLENITNEDRETLNKIISNNNSITSNIDKINKDYELIVHKDTPEEDIELIYSYIKESFESILEKLDLNQQFYLEMFSTETEVDLFTTLWKNLWDLNEYNKTLIELNNPIQIMDYIKTLDSFQEKKDNTNDNIVVYVKNLYDIQDPSQKSGGYFIYDRLRDIFIKQLVGSEIYENKAMLDAISKAFDDANEGDHDLSKFLTIRKERNKNSYDDEQSWEYKAQFRDVDLIPENPNDGKGYILTTNDNNELEWTNKLSSKIAFVKRDTEISNDSRKVLFENLEMTIGNENELLDSVIVFKNSLFINKYDLDYDDETKELEISLLGDDKFYSGDIVTLIVIRDTSAEMIFKLSNEFVSKKEAIDLLSNGHVNLLDYVRNDNMYKYTLRNHIHTNYANRLHNHDGIYASYNHNHDGYYTTREDVNKILGDILSVNPELVNIISQIANDVENLENTFITRNEHIEVINNINKRLDNIESIEDNGLFLKVFMDPNTGLVSQLVQIDEQNNYKPISIDSLQILTKYKKSDEPDETRQYNLEEWLDHISDLISSEENKIKGYVYEALQKEKVSSTLVLDTNYDEFLDVSGRRIENLLVEIIKPYDYPIYVMIGSSESDAKVLIDQDDILEDQESTNTITLNSDIRTESKIWVKSSLEEENGRAEITIKAYKL